MGSLIAFEGWKADFREQRDASMLIDLAASLAPSALEGRLSIAGKTSERRVKAEDLASAVEGIERSWSVTFLDKSSKVVEGGLLSSRSYFSLKMHRNLKGLYVYSDNFEDGFHRSDRFKSFVSELTRGRSDGFGYYTTFDSPVAASIYALDLRTTTTQKLPESLMPSNRSDWVKNFTLDASDRMARGFYLANFFPNHFWDNVLKSGLVDGQIADGRVVVECVENYTLVTFRDEAAMADLDPKLRQFIF